QRSGAGRQRLLPGPMSRPLRGHEPRPVGNLGELRGVKGPMSLRPDGTVVDRYESGVPQAQVLAVDHSGTNFLVEGGTDLARVSFTDTGPVRVGPAVAQASWW